ncbi:hypothetical protein AOLI_G00252200 [Acnodon oligacanthus]
MIGHRTGQGQSLRSAETITGKETKTVTETGTKTENGALTRRGTETRTRSTMDTEAGLGTRDDQTGDGASSILTVTLLVSAVDELAAQHGSCWAAQLVVRRSVGRVKYSSPFRLPVSVALTAAVSVPFPSHHSDSIRIHMV